MTECSELFAGAVDEGLSILGNATMRIIYELLESDYGIVRDDISERLLEFSEVLKSIFGPSSSDLILQHIICRFYAKLRLDPPVWEDLDEAVETVQRILKIQTEVNRDSDLILLR